MCRGRPNVGSSCGHRSQAGNPGHLLRLAHRCSPVGFFPSSFSLVIALESFAGSGKGGPWKPSSLFMVLLPSGLVGLLAGLLSQAGLDPWVFLAAFVLPHGVVEFAAAIIATSLILRIGASIVSPGQGNSIGDSILVAFADFMKMLAVIAPMFVIAALIEAEITPRVARYFLGG